MEGVKKYIFTIQENASFYLHILRKITRIPQNASS